MIGHTMGLDPSLHKLILFLSRGQLNVTNTCWFQLSRHKRLNDIFRTHNAEILCLVRLATSLKDSVGLPLRLLTNSIR